MILAFLSHTWKKFSRSVSFGKEVVTSIFLGFFALMMVIYSLALGFALDHIITTTLNISDSVTFLNGILFYYFGFEFMMRYFLQNLPVLDVQPYLHLPIKKSSIAHYLLGKSIVHVLNLLPLLLFTPFAFMVVAGKESTGAAWSWIGSIWLLSLSMHYIVILFKKQLDDSVWGFLLLISLFSLLGASDYFGWFKVSELSAPVFTFIIEHPAGIFIPLLLLALLYLINFRFFRQSMYIEDLATQKESTTVTTHFDFLNRFGAIGEWINVEIKLILRNKRPRNILFLSGFFLFYGLIFYTNKTYTEGMPGFLLFVGVFVTGIFMLNYGQFLFSWQGGHFDFIITQPISMREYIQSKYWLLCSVGLICFMLSIPYVYFGWKILLIHTVAALFNLGVNTFVILNIAMWEPKKIDLDKGAAFNYEGVGAAQWLMSLPVILVPYVIYTPFSLMGYPNAGLVAIGVIGLIGIALHKQLIDLTTKRLIQKKYDMAARFRKE